MGHEHVELRGGIKVPRDGFQWKDDQLEPISPEVCRTYDAFAEEPALFAKFGAMTKCDRPHVLEFASEYGAICLKLADWQEHQTEMCWLIEMWQQRRGTGPWEALLQGGVSEHLLHAAVHHFEPYSSEYERQELRVLQYLNQKIQSAEMWITTSCEAVVNVRDPKEIIKLQYLRAIKADKTLRHCEWCGAPFLIIPPSRSTRRFCKRSCAVMASKERFKNVSREES